MLPNYLSFTSSKHVYGRRTYHFKATNIVSLGSSSDVETDMLEELRKLKEHSRMQDTYESKSSDDDSLLLSTKSRAIKKQKVCFHVCRFELPFFIFKSI